MFEHAGHKKKILPSFLCAGYANGQKDSCEVSFSIGIMDVIFTNFIFSISGVNFIERFFQDHFINIFIYYM